MLIQWETKVFPLLIMILMVAASAVYAACGDYRRALYWFFAAAINATVTF